MRPSIARLSDMPGPLSPYQAKAAPNMIRNYLFNGYRRLGGELLFWLIPFGTDALIEMHSAQSPRESPRPTRVSLVKDFTEREKETAIQSVITEYADYLDLAKSLERGVLMVGFAVILSAILEIKSSGLSAYHALVVLNIS
ncbi:hypothetical protein H0H81_008557 [Sphagnurus paluster]|uniref:Cytochrome b-c1 complex subunit 8 n=1 Tax=Sphagnurus paluster TaxID=117069 RepID=A0A9P7K5Y3_9AGAR|nr:hypothetical protein H0H81_008557 [Sphagnurus paluster]